MIDLVRTTLRHRLNGLKPTLSGVEDLKFWFTDGPDDKNVKIS